MLWPKVPLGAAQPGAVHRPDRVHVRDRPPFPDHLVRDHLVRDHPDRDHWGHGRPRRGRQKTGLGRRIDSCWVVSWP